MTTVHYLAQNATGKSNLIEGLVEIFRHLDLDKEPLRTWRLRAWIYVQRPFRLKVKTKDGKTQIDVTENGNNKRAKLSTGKFSREAEEFLPRNIFAYYSGRNDRLEEPLRTPRNNNMINTGVRQKERVPGIVLSSSETPFATPIFTAANEHSQLILLVIL